MSDMLLTTCIHILGPHFDNEEFSDLTIIAGERHIHAHRLIIAKSSSEFAAHIVPVAKEPKQALKIDNVEPDILYEMIRFIYAGEVREFPRRAEALLIAATTWGLTELRERCERKIAEGLTNENVSRLLMFARAHDLPLLKQRVEDYVIACAKDVCRRQDFQALGMEVVCDLLVDIAEALADKIQLELQFQLRRTTSDESI